MTKRIPDRAHPKRLLWIVNHKTLLPAEVPIFRSLGYEVFIPKIVPDDPAYRSSIVTYEFDKSLSISKNALEVLNQHHFYGRSTRYTSWSPTIRSIINKNFDVIVSSISNFISPLGEAVRHFDGLVLARAFGLTHPHTYAELLTWLGRSELVGDMAARGRKFALIQGFSNISEIEPPGLAANAQTVTVPLPDDFFQFANSWTGGSKKAVFVCPGIQKEGYYRSVYESIKKNFGDIPHCIFGRQFETVEDPNILSYLSEKELVELYASAPVFVYPSSETRHIHYSPIEAMVVGAPVLYLRGALSDILTGQAEIPGRCDDEAEMREKAKRLIGGDRELAESIRATQGRIVDEFRASLAQRQWAEVLSKFATI